MEVLKLYNAAWMRSEQIVDLNYLQKKFRRFPARLPEQVSHWFEGLLYEKHFE